MMARLSRPRVMAVAVSEPGVAGAAILSPRGRQVKVAELPFTRRAHRRDVLDAAALAGLIRRWRPDVVTTWSDDHFPSRAMLGLALSRGVVEGVLAASGLPIGQAREDAFHFLDDAARARRRAVGYWPHAIEQLAGGSRALSDAALLANDVRDPGGYDDPRSR